MGDFQKFYTKYKISNTVLLTVNLGESKGKVEEIMQSMDLTMPVLLDENLTAAAKYQVRSIPLTIIIDKDGIIKTRHTGALTFDDLEDLLYR